MTRAYLRANLMAPSLASVPELQKNALSAKLFSTSRFARSTCMSGAGVVEQGRAAEEQGEEGDA